MNNNGEYSKEGTFDGKYSRFEQCHFARISIALQVHFFQHLTAVFPLSLCNSFISFNNLNQIQLMCPIRKRIKNILYQSCGEKTIPNVTNPCSRLMKNRKLIEKKLQENNFDVSLGHFMENLWTPSLFFMWSQYYVFDIQRLIFPNSNDRIQEFIDEKLPYSPEIHCLSIENEVEEIDLDDTKTIMSELPDTSTFYSSNTPSECLSISNSIISVDSDF